jgi:DNA-binding GntR family transcriptional regulator
VLVGLSTQGRSVLDSFEPPLARRPELWEIVANGVRRAIIVGDLQAGLRLQEETLADKFGVSRVPVREALTRLEHEGLIRSEPHRGAFVTGFRDADVDEVYDLREIIECRAAELAVEHASGALVQDLETLVTRMRTAARGERSLETAGLDVAFHRRLVQAAEHSRLLATWDLMSGVVASLLEFTNTFHPDAAATAASHQLIVDALPARDGTASVHELRLTLRGEASLMQRTLMQLRAQTDQGDLEWVP